MIGPKHDGGWSTLASTYLFESKWYNLRQDQVRLPSGDDITYTLVEHPGFVVVVPLTSDGYVILERIYRYTVQRTVIECPAGALDGESPIDAAKRELLEETGFEAGDLASIAHFFGSTGISDEEFHIVVATDLRDTGRTDREATEQMEIIRMPLDEAAELARSGAIADAPSALAILLAHDRR